MSTLNIDYIKFEDALVRFIKNDEDAVMHAIFRACERCDIELEIYDPLEHKACGDRYE